MKDKGSFGIKPVVTIVLLSIVMLGLIAFFRTSFDTSPINETQEKLFDEDSSLDLGGGSEDGTGDNDGGDEGNEGDNEENGESENYKYLNITPYPEEGGDTSLDPEGERVNGKYEYEEDTKVELTAYPNEDYIMGALLGCDESEGNECNVTMSTNRSVKVSFQEPYILDITVETGGVGTTIPEPGEHKYPQTGEEVTIEAEAEDDDYGFNQWKGDGTHCEDGQFANPCTLTVFQDMSITANFTKVCADADEVCDNDEDCCSGLECQWTSTGNEETCQVPDEVIE
ncbi:MAG: InlB B-repeat-containing protein [Candidatus Aenigmatarchaeota archaeon]